MPRTPLESWISRKIGLAAGQLSLAALREYQLHRLRETLRYVLSRSRFYQKHLSGMDPSSIRSMDDIANIPFTDSGMLAGNTNDFLCVSPRDVNRMVTLNTSGTVGSPKRLAFTLEDQELTVDFFHHGMTTFTRPSDRVLIFLPGDIAGSVGALLKKGLARFGSEGIVFGPIRDYGYALKALLEVRAQVAVGIPSQLLALSRFSESGFSTDGIQLRSVLLSTDYVPHAVVSSLSQAWGCEVYGHYGMTEMGLGGAVECSARSGYHMRDADLLFEIVDPATLKPVSDGADGEVVFSTLTRQGMPLIRYRTGDRSRFLIEPCPCGTILRRMAPVLGRICEIIRLKNGGSISITELDEVLLRDPCISTYEAEMHIRDGIDCLVLRVCSTQEACSKDRIYSRLIRHHALGAQIREGLLALDIRESDVAFYTTGISKRFIADKRTPTS